jgi:hypothetical protein
MGFLDEKSDSILVDVPTGAGAAIQVRPLAKKPIAIWVHDIPSVLGPPKPDGTATYVRGYATEVCTSTNGGSGCDLDHWTDPFWDRLPKEQQTNSKGQRKDFGKKPKFILPVYNFHTGRVQVIDKGSQIYKPMDQAYDQGQDIRGCDWKLWKTGEKNRTEYSCSPVVDPALCGPIPADQWPALERQAMELLEQVRKRYIPTPREKLMKMISGQLMTEQNAFPPAQASAPIPQLAAPTAIPGMPVFAPPAAAPAFAAPSPAGFQPAAVATPQFIPPASAPAPWAQPAAAIPAPAPWSPPVAAPSFAPPAFAPPAGPPPAFAPPAAVPQSMPAPQFIPPAAPSFAPPTTEAAPPVPAVPNFK